MNKKILINLLGLVLIFVALSPSIKLPNPLPPKPVVLDVEKPTEDVLLLVRDINRLISDKNDRTNLAVFNYVFSNRLTKYSTDVQKLNDVYVLAGEEFFQNSLKGKYRDLDQKIQTLFISVLGEDNHMLNEDEKSQLKIIFSGLSWSLIQ
jgi:hypothetical protein